MMQVTEFPREKGILFASEPGAGHESVRRDGGYAALVCYIIKY
jgi:hypothetical protein